jgi:DNA-binding transcriptional regulator GbsR (MarR family)
MKTAALSAVERKFILHWGEMGPRWGVNRTVAQVFALLYLSPFPLTAEDIAEALSVARSNVSVSLQELRRWRLARLANVMGDRRDHFETVKDVSEIARIVLEERKRRELDPTMAVLRECLEEAGAQGTGAHVVERLQALHDFATTASSWYEDMRGLPASSIQRFLRMGTKVRDLLGSLRR